MEENKTTETNEATQEVQTENQPASQPATQPVSGNNDVNDNKAMAIIGYIIPLLFFIPLVTDAKNSPFAKFHANQQLILLIAAIAVNVLGALPIIGWFIIWPLGTIALIVFAIIGIMNAARGEMKELPLVGGFKIIN